jgi:N6-L-threonylcarbamoyladenine synthase
MLVLGIESSCDETGAALIENGRLIQSNVVATQIEIHNRYGGVVPEVASRQQLAAILPVIETALEQAFCRWDDIDAVAATYGPGLAGSLLVGLTVGKTLSLVCGRPFLGVNHLEAHIYANWLRTMPHGQRGEGTASLYCKGDPAFPLLCLVVSGAHSELVLVREHGDYELLGQTRDDAAGEAFDKVARVLGLGYPGGPAIQEAAQQAEEALKQQHKSREQAYNAYRLPRAWLNGTYDFSFSGLKTAMLHLAEGIASLRGSQVGGEHHQQNQATRYTRMGAQSVPTEIPQVALLAASFQEAVVDVLARKTSQAAQEYHVKQVLLAGGVAANVRLRERLVEELQPQGISLKFPAIQHCTDNAAMIGSAAFFHLVRGERHGFDLDVQPGLSLPFRGITDDVE